MDFNGDTIFVPMFCNLDQYEWKPQKPNGNIRALNKITMPDVYPVFF